MYNTFECLCPLIYTYQYRWCTSTRYNEQKIIINMLSLLFTGLLKLETGQIPTLSLKASFFPIPAKNNCDRPERKLEKLIYNCMVVYKLLLSYRFQYKNTYLFTLFVNNQRVATEVCFVQIVFE